MTIPDTTLLLLGKAVLMSQKLEFVLYGLIAQAYHLPNIKRDKRFAHLTPQDFLSIDPEKRKLRKATLGQVIKGFYDMAFFSMTELESIAERRNFIAHELWRALEVDKIKVFPGGVADPDEFLIQFTQDCEEWISILRGFLSIIIESGMKNLGRESELVFTEEDIVNRERFNFVVGEWIKNG